MATRALYDARGQVVRRVTIREVENRETGFHVRATGKTGEEFSPNRMQMLQPAGSSSHLPVEDGTAIALFPDGNASHGYVIPPAHRSQRPNDQAPGSYLIHAMDGTQAKVILGGGEAFIETQAAARIKAPKVEVMDAEDVSVRAVRVRIDSQRTDINGQVYINNELQIGS